MKEKNKFGLIFADIDGTFFYHQTVAVANKLFIMYLCKFFDIKFKEKFLYTIKRTFTEVIRIKFNNFFKIFYSVNWKYFIPVFRLFWVGVVLFVANYYRQFINYLLPKNKLVSNNFLIKYWAKTVIKLNIDEKDYSIKKEYVKSSLNKKLFDKVKGNTLIGITESFTIGKNPIKQILSLKKLYQNEFIVKKGKIVGCKLNIKSGKDKKRIANMYKVKNVAVIVENYEDVPLLDIKNVKFIYYKKKLKKFVKIKGDVFK